MRIQLPESPDQSLESSRRPFVRVRSESSYHSILPSFAAEIHKSVAPVSTKKTKEQCNLDAVQCSGVGGLGENNDWSRDKK